MPKRVFICYRREDTGPAAGRVNDRLRLLLSKGNVFFDVNTIAGGEKFGPKIAAEIQRSDAVLIFIGDKWLVSGEAGMPRIADRDDYVRAEVRAALERAPLVIPVLVERAQMPRADLLPDDIRAVTALSALPLRHASFDDDTEALCSVIMGDAGKDRPWEGKSRLIVRVGFAIGGVVLASLALLAGALAHFWLLQQGISDSIGDNATMALIVAVLLLGAGLGWLYSSRRDETR